MEKLTDGPNLTSPDSFSRDGSRLIFSELVTGRGHDLQMLVLGGKPQSMTLLDGTYNERNGELSPDGRLLAYQSDESGRYEVYVAPFPDLKSRRLQVSSGGGVQPAWAGNELFYATPDRRIMSVAVTAQPVLNAGTRQVVLDAAAFVFGILSRTYDVSPDGTRFLFSQTRGAGNQPVVVLNWVEELKRLVPGDRE